MRRHAKLTCGVDAVAPLSCDKDALGAKTLLKFDATVNAKDMRYARNKDGTRKYEVSEYLSSQRVQSFFLRKLSRLRHREPEDDLDAENDDFVVAEDPVSVFSLLFT